MPETQLKIIHNSNNTGAYRPLQIKEAPDTTLISKYSSIKNFYGLVHLKCLRSLICSPRRRILLSKVGKEQGSFQKQLQ